MIEMRARCPSCFSTLQGMRLYSMEDRDPEGGAISRADECARGAEASVFAVDPTATRAMSALVT